MAPTKTNSGKPSGERVPAGSGLDEFQRLANLIGAGGFGGFMNRFGLAVASLIGGVDMTEPTIKVINPVDGSESELPFVEVFKESELH